MKFVYFVFLSFLIPALSFAFSVEQIDTIAVGDFIVSPAKQEVVVDPGARAEREIVVINRTEDTRDFVVSVEDFSGTRDEENPVALFGEVSGPYSLKQYVTPEIESFTLSPNEQATFTVAIEPPETISPGGLYGAVLVSSQSNTLGDASGAKIVSRIASLLLVTISGDVEYSGEIVDFNISGPLKSLYLEPPLGFEISFENTGTIHTEPQGSVRIINSFGSEIAKLNVSPFVVLPDSIRHTEVLWEIPGLRFGKYTAVAEIARGYEDKVDIKEISFWIIPVKEIVIILVLLIILIFASRFRARIKS